MRAFISIDFNFETKKKIAELQKTLKENCLSGRWKYVDNFHLTLKFLGEISNKQVKEIETVLKKVSTEFNPFILELSKLNYFQGKTSIRVLYLEVDGELKILKEMQLKLENMLESIGFPKERRPYTPHVTIAQDVIPKNEMELLNTPPLNEKILVDKIILMKSEQIKNKRIYSPIIQCSLKT